MLSLLKKVFLGKVNDTSEKNKVNMTDLVKLLRDGGILAVVTILTFVIQNISSVDFGEYTEVVIIVVTGVAQFIRKLLTDNTNEETIT